MRNDHNNRQGYSKGYHVTKEGKKAKKGLWYNIHKKRERGEKMRKKGDPGAPTDADIKKSQEETDLDESKMSQLHQLIKDGKTAAEIAKIMKVDAKTIKALMDQYESTAGDSMKENGKYMEMLAAACGAASTSRPPGTGPAA